MRSGCGFERVGDDEIVTADPKAGWHFMANGGYIGTGIPANVFYELQGGRNVPVVGFVGKGIIEAIFPSLDGAAVTQTESPRSSGSATRSRTTPAISALRRARSRT